MVLAFDVICLAPCQTRTTTINHTQTITVQQYFHNMKRTLSFTYITYRKTVDKGQFGHCFSDNFSHMLYFRAPFYHNLTRCMTLLVHCLKIPRIFNWTRINTKKAVPIHHTIWGDSGQ